MFLRKISNNVTVCSLDDFYWLTPELSSIRVQQRFNECIMQSEAGSTIIGYMLWELTTPINWLHNIKSLEHKLSANGRKFRLVLNSSYEQYTIQTDIKITYLAFFALRTWFESVDRKMPCGYNKTWDPASKKFVFTFGKVEKVHRIRLLYKLNKAGLLDKCTWSLHTSLNPAHLNKLYFKSKYFLPELTKKQFIKFIQDHVRNPEGIPYKAGTVFNYGGFPYDPKLFSSSLFRLSPECNIHGDIPWITEKTWITILNKQPFIIAAETGALSYLKNKGFKTFENYLAVPEYNELTDTEGKLDAIVTNVKYLINNCNEHKDNIEKDLIHNVRVFLKLVKENVQILQNLVIDVGLPDYDPYQLIPLYDDVHIMEWQAFYNGVKDPSWPECPFPENFFDLSHDIQKECIEVFGYTIPKYLNGEST